MGAAGRLPRDRRAGPAAAVRAGVDTIEHGGWLDEECVAEMAERGTWYVPTFAGYEVARAPRQPAAERYARRDGRRHLESFQRALEAGVRIACGSDAGVYGHDFTRELELLVAAGMTPREAIVAATSALPGASAGRTRSGPSGRNQADLLVVDGEPARRHRDTPRPGATNACSRLGRGDRGSTSSGVCGPGSADLGEVLTAGTGRSRHNGERRPDRSQVETDVPQRLLRRPVRRAALPGSGLGDHLFGVLGWPLTSALLA